MIFSSNAQFPKTSLDKLLFTMQRFSKPKWQYLLDARQRMKLQTFFDVRS